MFGTKLKSSAIVSGTEPVVYTPKGKIAGVLKDDVYAFRGIRYASAERFCRPVQIEEWGGIKYATQYGYDCPTFVTPIPQDELYMPHYFVPQNEDCLYLNIWTRTINGNADKPVIVWFHGGGWTSGSGVELFSCDGEELSKFGDVVVVSFNMRLNCLGTLDLSDYGEKYLDSGHCVIYDMLAALTWIRDNICCFGGDPQNITLFGHSGGAEKILAIMQSPLFDGLYHRVAIDSVERRSQEIPAGWTENLLAKRLAELTIKELGLSKERIEEINEIPYWDLVQAVMDAETKLKKEAGLKQEYRFEPVSDGRILCGKTFVDGFRKETRNIPMMIGNTFGDNCSNRVMNSDRELVDKNSWEKEEILRQCARRFKVDPGAIIEKFREAFPEKKVQDVLFYDFSGRADQLDLVKKRMAVGGEVYNWLFTKESPIMNGTVAGIGAELPFIFHNARFLPASFEKEVSDKLENIMAGVWISFARYGSPRIPWNEKWECCTLDCIYTMIFDTYCVCRKNMDENLLPLMI